MTTFDIEECAARAGVTVERLEELSEKAIYGYGELTREEILTLRRAKPPQPRACGSCNLCCVAPSIEGPIILPGDNYQPKAACVACSCVSSSGCSRYDNRPAICEDYQCMWSMGLIPEEYSPLVTGVAWAMQPPGGSTMEALPDSFKDKVLIVGHTLDAEAAFNNPDVKDCVISFLLDSNTICGVTIRDDKDLISITRNGYARAKIDPADPMRTAILESSVIEREYE